MNICIRSTFKCTFDVFYSKVMETEPEWSQFVDGYQIAKVDEHNSIIAMNVVDFEAMKAFMTTVEHINRRLDALFALDVNKLSRPELIAEINKISNVE